MANKNIMVCVTQQKTCKRLILEGHKIVQEDRDNLYVIHVVNEKEKFLEYETDGEALEYLFEASKRVGADLTVLKSKDVLAAIIDFARKHRITDIVLGHAADGSDSRESTFSMRLQAALPGARLVQV